MNNRMKLALSKAVEALYFDDNSDYGTYLWEIVEILGGEKAVELLEKDHQKAYDVYHIDE
jgi:hypothetical protein